MNEKSRPQNPPSSPTTQLTRVTRLLRRAQDSLHTALGRSPTSFELEEWTGVPEGTIRYWFSNRGEPTAEFVLQLLERMSERQRDEILDSVRRVYPSLEDSHLKCDRTIISQLKTIIRQPGGIVLLQGSDGESRTFLLTALGHAFLGLTARPRRLAGCDAHDPDWFVPLPGVRYFGNLVPPAKLLQAARDNWPKVQAQGAQMFVFNAIGAMRVDLQMEIKQLSARGPVLIAEDTPVDPSVVKRASRGPVHILTVSRHSADAKDIAVSIKAI